jgi:hypothetical protein
MAVTPHLDLLSPFDTPVTPHAIECKLLFERSFYTPCHIGVPDTDHRLPAIYVDNKFYSFFKTVPNAQKAVDVMARLSKGDEHVALTKTRQGYAVWAYEPEAHYAAPKRNLSHTVSPVFGPKTCLLLNEPTIYDLRQLRVPDVSKPMDGLLYAGRCYSIFKQGPITDRLLEMAAKLGKRGDDALMALAPSGCILALLEPGAQVL